MEKKSKAETFVGFAIKSGKCRIGTGAVETLKHAEIVILCKTASENTLKQAKKLARRLGAKLLMTAEKALSQMTYKENSKIMAVTDAALAKAIVENGEKEFVILE